MKSNHLNKSDDNKSSRHSHSSFHIKNLLDFSFGEENSEDIDMNECEYENITSDNNNENNLNTKENIKFFEQKTLFNHYKKNIKNIESPEKTQFLIKNINMKLQQETQFLIKKRKRKYDNIEEKPNHKIIIPNKIEKNNKKILNNNSKIIFQDNNQQMNNYCENSLKIKEDSFEYNNDKDNNKNSFNSELIYNNINQKLGFDYILRKITKIDLHNKDI